MNLQLLKSNKGARHRKKRVGRGNGSGLGTYSGRGMNGQNSRAGGGVRPGFEGGQTPFISRMPKLKGFRNPARVPFQVVNVKDLEQYNSGDTVDVTSLFEKGLVAKKNLPVKILGDGEMTTKLTVNVNKVSKSAEEKITKAGGTIDLIAPKPPQNPKKVKGEKKAKAPVKEEKAEVVEEKTEAKEAPVEEPAEAPAQKEEPKEDTPKDE